MKFFEEKDSTNTNACTYCRQTGHNAAHCKIAVWDYNEWYNRRVPGDNPHGKRPQWYNHWENYGRWFRDSMRATEKYNARLRREEDRKKAKETGIKSGFTRAKSKCGFCGSPDHNRRACPVMTQFIGDAYKANQNWRRAFYDFVQSQGIWIGAAIQVKEQDSYWNKQKGETKMGLITDIN